MASDFCWFCPRFSHALFDLALAEKTSCEAMALVVPIEQKHQNNATRENRNLSNAFRINLEELVLEQRRSI